MEERIAHKDQNRISVASAGYGLASGSVLGLLLGLLLLEDMIWGCVFGAAAGMIIGGLVDSCQYQSPASEGSERTLSAVTMLAYFYLFGSAVLFLAMIFNQEQIGGQLADLHGLPALAGYPITLTTISLGILIGLGLYRRTPWGYWLTLAYLFYLLAVPTLLAGSSISIFGNVIWPLAAGAYLLLRRRAYFDSN